MFKDDFLQQWKELYSVVKSDMIRTINNGDNISAEKTNTIIKTEVSRWFSQTQYHGVWLDKLSKKSPSAGSEFKKILSDIKVTPAPPAKIPSLIPYAIILVIVAALGYYLSSKIQVAWLKVIGFTLVPPFLLGSIFMQLWSNSVDKAKKEVINEYVKQLDVYGEKLIRVCENADKD